MALKHAIQQFEYGWDLYRRGERGSSLWSNIANFARSNGLSGSYYSPLHCLKVMAKSPLIDDQTALCAFALSCELAKKNKGLNHHVVRLCAVRAGLLCSPTDNLAEAKVVKVTQVLYKEIKDPPNNNAPTTHRSASTPITTVVQMQCAVPARDDSLCKINIYSVGRSWLIDEAQQAFGLSEEQAATLVDLHLNPQHFTIDLIEDYQAIQRAIRSGATSESVASLFVFEDVASMRGIYRVHCRNLVNRQGVSDVNTGGPTPPKAPRILRFLDSLTEDNWHGFDDVAALAAQYRSIADADPGGTFDADDVNSFMSAARLGNQLLDMKTSSARAYGIKQGWFKVLKGMSDGVKYLRQFEFDPARFRTYVRSHLDRFDDTEDLVREYRHSIAEVGAALAPNFFADLGFSEFSKPDTHVRKAVQALVGGLMSDRDVFRYTAESAKRCGVTPRQLDKIFYLIGSGKFYLADFHLNGDGDERRAAFLDILQKPTTAAGGGLEA